jgi:hypothetical protein
MKPADFVTLVNLGTGERILIPIRPEIPDRS